MFSIPGSKAPGLDGYNNHFFKQYWEVIGEVVTDAILDFFQNGKLLTELNVTTITLVPKIKVPSTTGDYKPIVCCSTIYKCITKLICQKLNAVLLEINN